MKRSCDGWSAEEVVRKDERADGGGRLRWCDMAVKSCYTMQTHMLFRKEVRNYFIFHQKE